MALHGVSITGRVMQVGEWNQGAAFDSVQGMPFHSTYQPSNRRKMREEAGVEVVNPLLLTFRDILAVNGSLSEGYRQEIRGVDVATDKNTVYYVERTCPDNTTDGVCSSSVKSAAPFERGGFYNISQIVKPETFNGTTSGLCGVVLIDGTSLLIADTNRSCFWKVDLMTKELQNRNVTVSDSADRRVLSPVRLALDSDPKRPALFVTSMYRVIMIDGYTDPFQAPPESVRRLAGPVDSNPDTTGYTDSHIHQDVRFGLPMIGPRSYSKCGRSLYVGDAKNNVVRQINTNTGATTTIAGIKNSSVSSSVDGPAQNATLYRPSALAITRDCCNLFVAEEAVDGSHGGAIRWLTLRHQDGEVLNVTTVAFINASSPLNFTALTLSQDDDFMYAGTTGGNIFQLILNRSLLHQCPRAPRQGENNYWVIILTVTLTSVTCIATILAVVFYRRHLCKSRMNGQEYQLGVPLRQAKQTETREKGFNPQDNADSDSRSWGEASDSGSFAEVNTAEDFERVVDKYHIRLDETREFALAKLMEATNNFGEDHLLSGVRGGYGDMYRASLRVGRRQKDVAIKRMRGELTEMKYNQFRAEVIMLSRLRHENVCRLIGYCKEGGHGILIYKFISGGSLHDRLHGGQEKSVLSNKSQSREDDSQSRSSKSQTITDATSSTCDNPLLLSITEAGAELSTAKTELCWGERLLIALQVATGLRYLHHEVKPRVVHRDIKCHNVLIERTEGSRRMRAIIIDFGLAKLDASYVPESDLTCGDEEALTIRTLARTGTPGYMAPEYACRREVTPKTDIYAFGVVLLELVTGRKAVEKVISADGRQVGAVNLVQWSRKWLSAKKPIDPDVNHIDRLATGFFDPRLVSGLTPTEKMTVHDVAQLGYQCTMDDATKRPKMKKIVLKLEGIKKNLKQDPDALSTLPEQGKRSDSSSDDCHSGMVDKDMMGAFAPEQVVESYAKEYKVSTDKTRL
ncbi:hypothetical protein CBR_g57842 [Chara braunii]|uniref:Protein kinase domain-containing protein n=1 Tax=Chara braunii TaxID=69332 RepID=A0A388K868_CHABU|nr:hypothetical protein CBR_g57842 [Chara braunii]|eukprot:GBG66240.1 hypothetical protein CBR_g57842 [Chara braunii]